MTENKITKVDIPNQYMIDLTKAVIAYAYNPEDPELCFWVALKYDESGQTASAFAYYLKCAERTTDNNLAYECLIKLGRIFEQQGKRGNSARGMYQHAICLMPKRPEAYYLLSRYNERIQDYVNGYTYAELGLQLADFNQKPLLTYEGYPGKWGLIFQKMVSSWWWGKHVECRDLLQHLKKYHRNDVDSSHWNAIQNNMMRLGATQESMVYRTFWNNQYKDLRYRFAGSESIQRNYSQIYQDMFILSMLKGKIGGTYLEIGTAGPEDGNNTKLLESSFGWKGTGIEWDKSFVDKYRANRKNPVIQADATKVDYKELCTSIAGKSKVIDYLQLDCEPCSVTYDIMTKIPFDEFKFAVITYEHDFYVDMSESYRDKSRKYLQERGYELVVSDLSTDGVSTFEDWYVHPELVDRDIVRIMKDTSKGIKHASEYMLPGFTSFAPAQFEWGEITENEWFEAVCDAEHFRDINVYERFFEVEKNDIVVDLGASVGPFTWCAAKKKPKSIISIEPHPELYKTLYNNIGKISGTTIFPQNIAVGPITGEWDTSGLFKKDQKFATNTTSKVNCVTFTDLLSKFKLKHIDFLKVDIEGAEYDIFTSENQKWIETNVKKIAGEFHLTTPELKDKFRKFRDTYLKDIHPSKILVLSTNLIDITWDLWNDHFIDFYSEVNLYIHYRKIS